MGWITSLALTSGGSLLLAPGEITGDGFIAKLNRKGELLWATYVGGAGDDRLTSIAVDLAGDVYAGGMSQSSDFRFGADLSVQPVIAGAKGPGFVLKLSKDGDRIVYSTKIAHSSDINGIAVDQSGSAYISGTAVSGGHPVTPGVVQPNFNGLEPCGMVAVPPCGGKTAARESVSPQLPPLPPPTNAFATKLTPDGGALVWSTYLGSQDDKSASIALAPGGNVIVAGSKIWNLDSTASSLLWTVPLPGISGAAVDANGGVYVTGSSGSPPFANALPGDRNFRTSGDSFVIKLDSEGVGVYIAYLAGEREDIAMSIAVDSEGNAAVAGRTYSQSFPTVGPWQGPFSRGTGFIARLNSDGSELNASTYVGDTRPFSASAITVDTDDNLVFAGNTLTSGYPPTAGNVFIVRTSPSKIDGPRIDAIENLASRLGGPVAPGEFVLVTGAGFGPDANVLMDGEPLEVFSLSATGLAAVVPRGMPVTGAREFIVESGGDLSNPTLMAAAPFAPAVFTQDGSGLGNGLIFNEDGTLNSPENPAAKGSVVTIVGNGVGVLTGVSESVIASKPVNVYIGGWFALGVDAQLQNIPGLPPAYVIKVFVPDPKPEHAPDYRLPSLVALNLEIDGVYSPGVSFSVK